MTMSAPTVIQMLIQIANMVTPVNPYARTAATATARRGLKNWWTTTATTTIGNGSSITKTTDTTRQDAQDAK